jgi:DNA replication protein DnaC
MTSWQPFARRLLRWRRHELLHLRRSRSARADADRAAPANHQVHVGVDGRPIGQGRLARRTLACGPRRARGGRRSRRRIERHLAEARLPIGKTFDSFDFEAAPVVSKAQMMALAAGDSWIDNGANLLLFGPPGAGKSHLAAAIGFALIENGRRVLFTRTSELVQRLQVARRELALESVLAKLDKYHLLILDDISYVSKDQAETSVLFELIGMRYERRSLLITANQPFGEWGKVFPDQAMTLAAIDRLVHHATIIEMNVESYRRRAAIERKRGPGRPATRATIKASAD